MNANPQSKYTKIYMIIPPLYSLSASPIYPQRELHKECRIYQICIRSNPQVLLLVMMLRGSLSVPPPRVMWVQVRRYSCRTVRFRKIIYCTYQRDFANASIREHVASIVSCVSRAVKSKALIIQPWSKTTRLNVI